MQKRQNSTADQSDQSNTRYHIRDVESRFQELIERLREDVNKIEEPHARALLETSAEVLGGLQKAFVDYEKKNEAAWR